MNPSPPPDRSDKSLFFEALDAPNPNEREAFLQIACEGDPAQRKRVEALLESHFRKRHFMEQPAAPSNESPFAGEEAEKIGVLIGKYRVLERLGEGGFGTVYVAEQTAPVKRLVAVKIIKLGMDTRQVVARFEVEQRALALMDHPNIAHVYDAGATDTGRPYFVMELVRGAPITKFCAENNLTTAERLKLFMQVCRALGHAHQKGIIHRDIKPSNILVTEQDGEAVPKVIDFGIAKATQGDLTEQTVHTEFLHFIGTPAYMSPEQADMSGLGVDTRTDIYSLGVLLYELLVGETPFGAKELARAGLDDVRRIIREKEPERPSTRVMRGIAGPNQQNQDRVELVRFLRGDLDWIVMKCLAKDRGHRYSTAHALMEDLQRHLSHEPVMARPPTVAYQLQKTWRRHKFIISAASVVGLILVVATGISMWQAIAATKARQDALQAKNTEGEQRRRADEQKERAERNLYAAKMGLLPVAWKQNDFLHLWQLLRETEAFPDRGFEWRYWRRKAHESVQILRGHAWEVRSAVFSPDSKRLATASEDGTAKIWDTQTGAELITFNKHPDFLTSIVWSADGKWVASCSMHEIRGWDPNDGRELFTIPNQGSRVGVIAVSPDDQFIAGGCGDGTVRIFRRIDQSLVKELRGKRAGIRAASFSPDSRFLVVSGTDFEPTVYDVVTGAERLQLRGHRKGEWIRNIAFSADGKRIGSACDDQTGKVWDAADGTELFNLDTHDMHVSGIAFSPNGQWIATASYDWTAKLWNTQDGREFTTLKGHQRDLNSVAFSRDSSKLATTSLDHTAIIWNLRPEDEGISLGDKKSPPAVAISPDCELVAVISSDFTIRILKTETGRELMRLPQQGEILCMDFSANGQFLFLGGHNRTSIVCDLTKRRSWPMSDKRDADILAAAWSPDSSNVVIGAADRTLTVCDGSTGRILWKIDTNLGPITAVTYSRDGKTIGIGSIDNFVALYDAQSGSEVRKLRPHEAGVWAIAFSPDGSRMATGSKDRTARIFDTKTGKELLVLNGHGGGLYSVAFSPDGRRVVTGSGDRMGTLWNAEDGRQLLALPGPARSIRFAQDGKRIASAGAMEAHIWKSASDDEIAVWDQRERDDIARGAAAEKKFVQYWQAKIENATHDPGGVRRWRTIGPFPLNPGETGADALKRTATKAEMGGEPNFDETAEVEAATLRWQPLELTDYTINFYSIFGSSKSAGIGYAVCFVDSDTARNDLRMLVGSDDQSRIYLNGQVLYDSVQTRSFKLDEDQVENVPLRAGRNTLLFKVVNESSAWLGSIRLTDRDGHRPQGIRFSN